MENKPIVSEYEYIQLTLRLLDNVTLTEDELNKIYAYERANDPYNSSAQEKGRSMFLTTTAGKLLAPDDKKQGFVNATIIIGAAILTGVIAAVIALGL